MRWSSAAGAARVLCIVLLVVERGTSGRTRPAPSARASRERAGRFTATWRASWCSAAATSPGPSSFSTRPSTSPARSSSLAGASLAISLYVLHNAVSALAAFPLGALSDRVGRKTGDRRRLRLRGGDDRGLRGASARARRAARALLLLGRLPSPARKWPRRRTPRSSSPRR